MKRVRYYIIGLILIFLFGFFSYHLKNFKIEDSKKKFAVKLTDTIDPDIVLVNLEEGDRSFIGNLLQKIDSCKPRVIGVDAFFIIEKDSIQDSVLMKAFEDVQNDIVAYYFDSTGTMVKSASKFVSSVAGEGYVGTQEHEGLLSFFKPILTINNKNYEHFSLKVIRYLKPDYKFDIKINKSVPIHYTRTLDQFKHFDGSVLTTKNCDDIKYKIVLVGYLGPKEEDKHFTPIRYFGRFDADEPDTYGLVINANIIRTILEYDNE